MSIDTPGDWDGLRAAGRVAHEALVALQAAVRVGISTAELDRVALAVFARHGARSAPQLVYDFPGTVLICVNDEIVHGVPGPRRLCAGDLVKLDVTVEKDGYVADAARSVIVAAAGRAGRSAGGGAAADARRNRAARADQGRPGERAGGRDEDHPGSRAARADQGRPQDLEARRLITCAEDAFAAALSVARAGRRVNEISRAVQELVEARGYAVVPGLAGHGVGRTIHEAPRVPNEYDPLQVDVLTEGLVITIEPIICAGRGLAVEDADGWTLRTRDGSLAAHYEQTLMITRDTPIILTAA